MENQTTNSPVMHDFNENRKSTSPVKIIAILLAVAILGAGTGYIFSNNASESGGSSIIPLTKKSSVVKGKTYGSNDTETFKDIAEGELQEGGVEGEGQFHLVRPGGESQNVYLTSSLVDLSLFEGKKVKVWGQTQKAQTAGWLMDVGRVEALE